MIRTIMLSSAYRQTSLRASAKEEKADPENQLLWRQNGAARRRHPAGQRARGERTAESGARRSGCVSAAAGCAEGSHDHQEPSELDAERWPEARERSVYVFQRRQLEMPFLSVMDAGVFQTSCERAPSRRPRCKRSTLLNDDFVGESAKYFAERAHGIDEAFRLAFARSPRATSGRKPRR